MRFKLIFSAPLLCGICFTTFQSSAHSSPLRGLSPAGVKFIIDSCRDDRLLSMNLSNVRRWQKHHSIISGMVKSGEIRENISGALMKEVIDRDLDQLHQWRRDRRIGLTGDELLKFQISEITYDFMFTSAVKTFVSYRFGGEDLRLNRLLEENCLGLVDQAMKEVDK